jgi:hypothetical protein
MPSVGEGVTQGPPIQSPLLSGLQLLSGNALIPFTRYVRWVLPLDGYVFWLRGDTVMVRGSVHVTNSLRVNEDETLSTNAVVFTTETAVDFLQVFQPNTMWVGQAQGVRFSFSRNGPRYSAAGIFHYVGDAVYPALASQLVDAGAQLSSQTLVVSNSLPAWLSLPSYNPVWVSEQIPNPFIDLATQNVTASLYPSYAVPQNVEPPYGSVHVFPERTAALASHPMLDKVYTSQWQLTQDHVRVTLYGFTNEQAMDFEHLVTQYSMDTDSFGLMQDLPITRDEKRPQAEIGVLAMKKTLEYTVSYLQGTLRTVARKLIESATVTVIPEPYTGE